jgi:uncharacterized membrane protein YhaH (DUF805 family)
MDTIQHRIRRHSRRRPFWYTGHAFMAAAVVMWVIGQIQYASAPTDDNFLAGFAMFVFGTIALMIGLLVYVGTGLFALIAHIRRRRGRRRA